MAHDVFISYSIKDDKIAGEICAVLEKNNIRCWIAPRDINPGEPFAEAIIDGIKGSAIFILVYSSNSNNSVQVIKEVDRAVHQGLAIIPFRIEDVTMSKQLEYYLSDVHWLDASSPPLEEKINKLLNVVTMLLKKDQPCTSEIKEAADRESTLKANTGKPSTRKKAGILILLTATILIGAAVTVFWYFKEQSGIRWAKYTAIPELRRMIGENDLYRNLVAPYELAEKAEAILGKDTVLASIFRECSTRIDILTEPSGANVYFKEYYYPEREWKFLGRTPMKDVRVPFGIFRWKVEKEGYEPLIAASSTWNDEIKGYNFFRRLDKGDSIPAGMVRVPATETDFGRIGDFFIGRFEVTNSEYKAFIDAGGYREKKYWNYPFLKDGRSLTFEEAMKKFVDQTGQSGPSSWMGGGYPDGKGDYPVSGISWYEAEAFAEWAGKSLPTSVNWDVARGAYTPMIRWPQLGGLGILAPFTNFSADGPVAKGILNGVDVYGTYDMAGNVREWCWNETKGGRIIRGGSYQDNAYEFGYERYSFPMDRSPRNGFRLAFYPDSNAAPSTARGIRPSSIETDLMSLQPVSDDIFKVYLEQFEYDQDDLNATIISARESGEGWIHEVISFNAAYGDERMLIHLFLPTGRQSPFQLVIFFPGSDVTWYNNSDDIENIFEFRMFVSWLVKNGRAVAFPVYKGTFERGGTKLNEILDNPNTHAYTELLIREVKDFKRTVDYLQTRTEIDSGRIAFLGMSWGGDMGAIIPAVEKRLAASVLIAGCLYNYDRPESNPVNYVRHVRTPTLMLNGKYDSFNPVSSLQTMIELIGTSTNDKNLILYETDHIPPKAEYIKETLAWLDKYLGPVK